MGFYDVCCAESGLVLSGNARLMLIAAANAESRDRYEVIGLPMIGCYDRLGLIDLPDELDAAAKAVEKVCMTLEVASSGDDFHAVLDTMNQMPQKTVWNGRRIAWALVDDGIYRAIVRTVAAGERPEWAALKTGVLEKADLPTLLSAAFALPEVSRELYGDLLNNPPPWMRTALEDAARFRAWGTALKPVDIFSSGQYTGYSRAEHDDSAAEPFVVAARKKYKAFPQVLEAVAANEARWRGLDGETDADDSDADAEDLPPDAPPPKAAKAFMNGEFPELVAAIRAAVGSVIPVAIDFRNGGERAAGIKLLARALRQIRATLMLWSEIQSASVQPIQRIVVRAADDMSCTRDAGMLRVGVLLDPEKQKEAVYDPADLEVDIDRALSAALNVPPLHEVQSALQSALDETNKSARVAVKLEVDWRSFAASPDRERNRAVVSALQREHNGLLVYLRMHAMNSDPFKKRLKESLHTVRLEHVDSAKDRELRVDDARILYRVNFTEDGGTFGFDLENILLGAVLAVQPAPEKSVKAWTAQHGREQLERAARISNVAVRAACEEFVRNDLPQAAAKIQESAGHSVEFEIDWDSLARSPAALPQLVARVLQLINGAVLLVARTKDHANLLRSGSLQRIAITVLPSRSECVFEAGALRLTVDPTQPRGCPDEGKLAEIIARVLSADAETSEVRELIDETVTRIGEDSGTLIDFEVDWAGLRAESDSDRYRRAVGSLRGSIKSVWHALGVQDQDRLRDRVRKVLFVCAKPGVQDESWVTSDGAALIYHLSFQPSGENDELETYICKAIDAMPPGAPRSKAVADALERCERESIPAATAQIAKKFGREIALRVDTERIGNSLIAAHGLSSALAAAAEGLCDFDKEECKTIAATLEQITIRCAAAERDNACELKSGHLTLTTWLGSARGSGCLTASDMYNGVQDALSKLERDRERAERPKGHDHAAWFDKILKSMFKPRFEQYAAMLNEDGGSIQIDGEWDAFREHLRSAHADTARMCLERSFELFMAALLQRRMADPAFGKRLCKNVTKIQFVCAKPGENKAVLLDNGMLLCRLQPTAGMAGGFEPDQAGALVSKLVRKK